MERNDPCWCGSGLKWKKCHYPKSPTHSLAADSELNRVFVAVGHEGVKVYTDDHDNGEGPDN